MVAATAVDATSDDGYGTAGTATSRSCYSSEEFSDLDSDEKLDEKIADLLTCQRKNTFDQSDNDTQMFAQLVACNMILSDALGIEYLKNEIKSLGLNETRARAVRVSEVLSPLCEAILLERNYIFSRIVKGTNLRLPKRSKHMPVDTTMVMLLAVCDDLVKDGICNWGRVVAMCATTLALSRWLTRRRILSTERDGMTLGNQLAYCLSGSKMGKWIEKQGTWDSFLYEFDGVTKRSTYKLWSGVSLVFLGLSVMIGLALFVMIDGT